MKAQVSDAIIEFSQDPEVREAFLGDAEYSPLLVTLAAVIPHEDIRRVLVPVGELPEAVREHPLLAHEKVQRYQPADNADIPARDVARSLRKWNHSGSLFGTLMTTEYGTFGNPNMIVEALGEELPDVVVVLSGAHGFVTEEIVRSLLETSQIQSLEYPIYVTSAPRGMSPIAWVPSALAVQAEENSLPQSLFWSYGSFWGSFIAHAPTAVTSCRRDFSLASARGRSFCRAVAAQLKSTADVHAGVSPEAVVEAALGVHDEWAGDLPRDVEIEITTKRPFTPAYFPPLNRADAEMSLEDFEKIVKQFEPHAESVNLTLGGFGDALEHPQIMEFIRAARPYVNGLNVRTFGLKLDDELFKKLTDAGMDVLNLRLGYWGAEPYEKLNGVDAFEDILGRLGTIRKRQLEEDETSLPMIVPEVVKGVAGDGTVLEMLKYCQEYLMSPLIRNWKTYGGALESQQELPLFPATRKPCVRISEQLLIYADGSVPLCVEDFDARDPIGNAFESPVADLWRHQRLKDVRASHEAREWTACNAACGKCGEWYQITT